MFHVTPEFRTQFNERLTPVMVVLSIVFLLTIGGIVHRMEYAVVEQMLDKADLPPLVEEQEVHPMEVQIMWWGLHVLWPLFLVEFLVLYLISDREQPFWRANWYGLVACAMPPLRIGSRVQLMGKRIWIPFMGWQVVDRHLRRKMEKFFSVPMIIIALLILPLLMIQYGGWAWAQHIRELPHMQLYLDIGEVVIWFAFAIEFVLMVSIAEKKWIYCLQHWLDLAIILLPMIQFLRSVRILRLARVAQGAQQLTTVGRLYRMRGLWYRAWRAVLLLNVIQRVMGQSPEKRLVRLEELLQVKLDEVEDLRKEIGELKAGIEAKKRASAAASVLPTPSPQEAEVS